MVISLFRTVILYIAVMAAMRLMGKRQIGELQPSELVITIMLGDLASVPMQDTSIPILNGIVPIVTLLLLEVILSLIGLKNKRARKIICGSPSIVIRDGQINVAELRRLRFSVDDLIEEVRNKDIADINNVQMAIIDTNGQFCIIPKAENRPLTPRDIGMKPLQEELPHTLISDGKIISENLPKIGRNEKWLYNQLKRRNIAAKNVFLATYTREHGLTVQGKRKE